MKVTRYHKLVRDKNPNIIEQSDRQRGIGTISRTLLLVSTWLA